MDFSHLEYLKPHVSLKVVERDLSHMIELSKKPTLDGEDLKIDYTSERLQKGEIEIPIFKNPFIRPFSLKGHLAQYFVKDLGGGFYEIIFENGKIEPKPTDRRHPNKEIDRQNGGEFRFWIGYHHENKHYYAIEEEAVFLKKYAPVEEAFMSEEVLSLLAEFQQFITRFSSVAIFESIKNEKDENGKSKYTKSGSPTLAFYHDLFQRLQEAIPMLENYHTLLNIMNDIDDDTHEQIKITLSKLKNQFEKHLETLRKFDLNTTIGQLGDHYDSFKPIEHFYGELTTEYWVRGCYIDPKKDHVLPNFLEIHSQRQLAKGPHFESDESLRIKKREMYVNNIEKAKKDNKILFIPV